MCSLTRERYGIMAFPYLVSFRGNLCGILAVFLIVVLLTIYFIFRRLHIDLTILRTVFQEQKRPSHPATLTISDIPPGSETADLPQVPASAAKTKKQHTLLIIEDHLEIRLYLKLIFSNEYYLPVECRQSLL